MDRYDPEKRVGLIVDEWGTWYDVEPGTNPGFLYQQNTMRDALVAAITLNIFNRHCDRVVMANLAQTVNVLQSVLLTEGDKVVLTPTYHVFDLYKAHQGAPGRGLLCGDGQGRRRRVAGGPHQRVGLREGRKGDADLGQLRHGRGGGRARARAGSQRRHERAGTHPRRRVPRLQQL